MSLMEKIFGAKTQNVPVPQPGVTNNLQTNQPPTPPQQSAQTAPNGTVPAGSNQPPAQSPEDKFAKLWETPATDPNAPKSPDDQNTLTPEKMLEAAGKIDFKRVLDQDSLRKIAAGGDEAVAAMAELLNKTAQTVYGQSTVVAQKLIETQVAKAREQFTAELPSLVKKQNMQDSLLTENPAFKKPSVAPVVAAIQNQLAAKFPGATASELNQMAKEYLKAAAEDFSPTPKKEPTAAERGVDWDQWVESSAGQ
jgi:hypothetical protein